MKLKLATIGTLCVLCGCETLAPLTQEPVVQPPMLVADNGERVIAQPEAFQAFSKPTVEAKLMAEPLTVNQYARGIMHKLINNLEHVTVRNTMAVASFVYLDGDFQHSDLLGNQLAESFVHELHTFGVAVVDFKTLDFLRVTPTGDYVFSRDYLELAEPPALDYVLTGTLVNHQGGVIVNARVIGVKSKAVVASAQGFLPEAIVQSMYGTNRQDGIMLKKG